MALPGVALAGASYALMAKCNTQLARDLGETSRAVMVCACVTVVASLPLCATLYFWLHVKPVFLLSDWPKFVFAGLQNAFYIGSMSVLPSLQGYTVCFMAVQGGSLCASTLMDAMGIAGKEVPLTMLSRWLTFGA